MSNDEDGSRMWGAEIPAPIADAADACLQWGEKTPVIRAVAATIAYGEDDPKIAAIDKRIQQVETQLQNARERRMEIDAEIEEAERRLKELQDRRANVTTEAEQLRGALKTAELKLRRGSRLWAGHGDIQNIAERFNTSPEEVLDKLVSRNPDVPEWAFQKATMDDHDWSGVPEEQVRTPVDEREEQGRDET